MKNLNKLLALVLAMVMTLGLSVTALGAYADVEGRWMAGAVEYVTEKGLMDGTSEDAFSPDTNADRATVVVALYRLAGSPEVTAENPFADVAEDASYYNAVVWAYETGVTTGTSDTTFGPSDLVTRQQFAAFVQRYTKNCGYDVTVAEDFTLDKFSDADSVQSYAVEPVRWACSLGLIQGSGDKLNPRNNTKRAELATIVMRYAEMDFEAAEETEKNEETEKADDVATILEKAYALKHEEVMANAVTLTGVITKIVTRWSDDYKNITVDFQIGEHADKIIRCYRMVGEGAKDLIVGDTITVSGKLTRYNDVVEFQAGCTMDAVEKTGIPVEAPVVDMTDPAAVVKAAYALGEGEELPEKATLTGVVTKINEKFSSKYNNVTLTFVVEGLEDMPLLCYRLKGIGADTVAVGDTITVSGNIVNWDGTIEFNSGCKLESVVKP